MNYVRRDLGTHGSVAVEGFAIASRRGRKWPISYRSVEIIATMVDAATILLAGVLSGIVYHLASIRAVGDFTQHVGSSAIVLALFISLTASREFYKPEHLLDIKSQVRGIALIWTGVFLFLAAIVFTLKIGEDFSRGAILSFAASGLSCLLAERVVWRNVLQHALNEHKFSGRSVLLITNSELTPKDELLRNLLKHGFETRHHFPLPPHRQDSRERDQAVARIVSYLRGSTIHEVVVSSELDRWSELSDLLAGLRKLPLPVNLIPFGPAAEILCRPSHRTGDSISIELQRGPLSGAERSIKRAFDVICASLGVFALLPLLAITALAIKIDSPGPILFRQRRCGFNGQPFRILKFRTMVVLEDGETIRQATHSDDRVTRVGKFLRRASIDELPQLFNVLEGSMSLVGPRPHALAHDSHFDKLVRNYAFRHHVKPGLTGWAQVNGYRGPTPGIVHIRKRVEHDLWYINNWSFSLDCAIMIRTAFVLIQGKNAC